MNDRTPVTPLDSVICPFTGLPVTKKTEWRDQTFGSDNYRITFLVIGGNIIYSKVWGYTGLHECKEYIVLLEKVAAALPSQEKKYFLIEDYTDHDGTSTEAKNHFSNYHRNNHRLGGLIFCTKTVFFKVMIKIRKGLVHPGFPVEIVDAYEQAIALAFRWRQNQSNAVMKSNERVETPGAREAVHGTEASPGKCPVTGLPVAAPAEWTDVDLGEGYFVTFRLIGSHILQTIPSGNSGKYGMKRLFQERQIFLSSMGLLEENYAEIKDYSGVIGPITREGRVQFGEGMVDEKKKGCMLGYWGYGASRAVKWNMNVGAAMGGAQFPLTIVNNYEEAVTHAAAMLKAKGTIFSEKQEGDKAAAKSGEEKQGAARTVSTEWKLDLDGLSCAFLLIDDETLLYTASGDLKEHHIEPLFDLYDRVINESGLAGRGYLYQIADWSALGPGGLRTRKLYIQKFAESIIKYPCKSYVVFGLSRILRAVVALTNQFFPVELIIAKDLDDAVGIVNRQRSNSAAVESKKEDGAKFSGRDERQSIDKLLQFMGEINWDIEGTDSIEKDIPSSHPFRPLYEAVALVKLDFDALLKEKDKDEQIIAEQNKFNRLRAEIWKLAAQKSVDEQELIQELLNKIGPVFNVSRVCFLRFQFDESGASELMCEIEWLNSGIPPSVGKKIPGFVVKQFVGRDYEHTASHSALEMVLVPLMAAADKDTAANDAAGGGVSTSAITYQFDGKLHGLFTFDICRSQPDKPAMTEEMSKVAQELVAIVSNNVAQKRAEEELKQSYTEAGVRAQQRENEYYTKTILESLNTGFVIVDAVSREIVEANTKAVELFGALKESVIGTEIQQFILPARSGENPSADLSGTIDHLECAVTGAGGNIIPIILSVVAVTLAGRKCLIENFIDITERKQIEDALREREALFQSVVNNNSNLTTLTDENGTLIFVSPQCEEVLGLSAEDLAGENPFHVHPDDIEAGRREWERVKVYGETSQNFEYRIVDRSGGIRWISHSVQRLHLDGRELGIQSSIRNITGRKQTEAALRESEERFRSLYEQSTIGLYRTTPEGKILMANPAVVKMLGFSSFDELASRNLENDGYDDSSRRTGFKNQIENEGQILGLETSWKAKDGSLLYVRESARAIRDADGKTLYYDGTVEDITERHHAEIALAAERTLLKTLINAIPDRIYVKDASSRFILNNAAHIFALGASSQSEVAGKTDHDFRTPEFADRYLKDDCFVIQSGQELIDIEEPTRLPSGNIGTLLVSKVPLRDPSGNVIGLVGVSRNITERKRAEQALSEAMDDLQKTNLRLQEETDRANAMMVQADLASRAKGQFLANMSHEIRTPMNAIIGFTEILSQRNTDPTFANYLRIIRTSGDSLLSLINDILEISKIESGKIELHPENVDLKKTIEDIGMMFSEVLKDKGLKLLIEADSGLPAGLLLDEVRIRQILINLVNNAIKFCERGHIKIAARHAFTGDQKTSAVITLVVEDTGIGIPGDQIDRIFKPFEQVDGQSTRKYGGTGLGLAITSNLITKMNGTLSVRSEVGKGSAFVIQLPDVSVVDGLKKEESHSSDEGLNVDFGGKRILVVDDVDYNRMVVKSLLVQNNADVLTAESAATGMIMLGSVPVDLLIIDMKMPEMNGIEFAERLDADEQWRKIPRIAYTASGFKEEEVKVIGKFNGFLPKPVTRKTLIDALKEVLPFTINKTETEQKQEETLEPDAAQRETLLQKLNGEFLPRWTAISELIEIGAIRSFAEDLRAAAAENNSSLLVHYADELIDAADSFKVVKIKQLLREFPGLKNVTRSSAPR